MHVSFPLQAGNFTNAGAASSEVKRILKQLNIPSPTIKRIVVALFEAEVNVIAHSYGGEMVFDVEPGLVTVQVKDEGPGIPDLEMAMKEGFSTASAEVREMGYGAGMGLPNIKKNADDLRIDTGAGKNTNITMKFKLPEESVWQ